MLRKASFLTSLCMTKGMLFDFHCPLPYRDSNLLSKTFYASNASEVSRLARSNSKKSLFMSTKKILLRPMYNQGPKWEHLIKVLNEMCGKHTTDFKNPTHTAKKK